MTASTNGRAAPRDAVRLGYANPSRWSRRVLLAALALAGFAVAGYLALYQFGVLATVWDPLFGGDSSRVLHSAIERYLPLPDAALGAAAYVVEFVVDLLGGSQRWRRQPWAVLLFGIVVIGLALTAVGLASIQVFALHAFCTLCLTSAAISLVVAALAADEIVATIGWLRMETGLGRSLRDAVLRGEVEAGYRPSASAEPGPGATRKAWRAEESGEAPERKPGDRPANQPGEALGTQPGDLPATQPGETPGKESTMTYDSGQPVRDFGAQGLPKAGHGGDASTGWSGQFESSSATSYEGAQGAGAGLSRPGGPDVDGGNEELWRGPDRSTGERGKKGGVVAITGAAAGVGRAAVREFAKHGFDVGLIARDQGSLENARAEVESCGGRAVICAIDVADPQAVDQAAQQIEDELGPIDVWVNDAMVSVFSPVKEMKPEDYKRVTEVNYLGYVYGTQAALKRMLPRDSGVIVHVGSALAYRAIPLQSAYCASKHAIQGFHESLRTELIHDKSRVRTTMVQMPALNTPQFDWVENRMPDKPQPVPPIYQPEVAAEAIYWASQHDRREVVVGVTTWGAIQLNKLIPGMLDWYLAKTGYKSQQTNTPDDPNRPNDVWEPVEGDHGAHGAFDARSAPMSKQLWATTHRPIVAGAVGALGLLVLGGAQLISSRLGSGRD